MYVLEEFPNTALSCSTILGFDATSVREEMNERNKNYLIFLIDTLVQVTLFIVGID